MIELVIGFLDSLDKWKPVSNIERMANACSWWLYGLAVGLAVGVELARVYLISK